MHLLRKTAVTKASEALTTRAVEDYSWSGPVLVEERLKQQSLWRNNMTWMCQMPPAVQTPPDFCWEHWSVHSARLTSTVFYQDVLTRMALMWQKHENPAALSWMDPSLGPGQLRRLQQGCPGTVLPAPALSSSGRGDPPPAKHAEEKEWASGCLNGFRLKCCIL